MTPSPPAPWMTLRVARPTNSLPDILKFYHQGLGLDVLGDFKNHEGFDGVMLGARGCPYHLEFTTQQGHVVPGSPSKENLLVFYYPDSTSWKTQMARMENSGFKSVPSHNPYWDLKGKTYEDFEGYRVVVYWGSGGNSLSSQV